MSEDHSPCSTCWGQDGYHTVSCGKRPVPPAQAPASVRVSWDDYFFQIAMLVASRGTCPRAQIGCVIVDPATHRILATGYNGAPAGEDHCDDIGCEILADHCIRAVHAEVNAAQSVRPTMANLVAYVSGARPVCSHCARELWKVGVRDVRVIWTAREC